MLKKVSRIYRLHFSCLLAIYRDNFEETRDFPVAYASAVVTMILSFVWIAFSYLLVRTNVWPDSWIDFPGFVSSNRVGAFVVLVLFYLSHCIYFVRRGRWKLVLAEFDGLNANQRRFTYISLAVISVSSITWMVVENILS